jgi:hypothetical protein
MRHGDTSVMAIIQHWKESDGYVHPKLWDKAMKDFLEWCRVEIVACTQIAEAVLRVQTGSKQ